MPYRSRDRYNTLLAVDEDTALKYQFGQKVFAAKKGLASPRADRVITD